MTSSTTDLNSFADGTKRLQRRWTPTGTVRAAMLLVHGIGEHSGRYEHVGSAFAETGIDVLSFDQRGFGESGGTRAYVDSFDQYLDDLLPQMGDRRTLDVPVILMGHSLGGLVVSSYLVSDRPQPDLAVLSSPALSANAPAWQKALAPVLGTILPTFSLPADFDGAVLSRDPEVATAYETDPLRVPSATARLGREIFSAMGSTGSSLDRLRVPTYVLHGQEDTLVPPSASEPLSTLPNVTRRVWPNLRHECLNEPEKDEVIAEIITWLDDHL